MKEEKPLDAQCILILGDCSVAIKDIASLLAGNGAIVFISAPNDVALRTDLEHIRQQVLGCSVSGTVVDVRSAASIADFVLTAEIALPKHDALIYFPDESVTSDEFIAAAYRLFALMAGHGGGAIINIWKCKSDLTKMTELSAMLNRSFRPWGIRTAELGMDLLCGDDESKAYADDIAHTVLRLLCESNDPLWIAG